MNEPMNRGTRRHHRNRAAAIANLGGRCTWCGLAFADVLQVDHVNGGTYSNDGVKRLTPKERAWQYNRRAALGDIAGLQLLCANCHDCKTKGYTHAIWLD
jgi:hypothetical protein